MDAKTKSPTGEATPDLDTLLEDIASLKRDFATLMRHVKNGAGGATRGGIAQVSDEAQRLYEDLAARSERSVEALGRRVEEQPVTSLLVAFGVGFVVSRLLSR